MASAIVGLMGLKRSGKDTVAARLSSRYGHTRVALADPIRDYLLAQNAYVPDPVQGNIRRLRNVIEEYGWEMAKDSIPEVRRLLQAVGDEAGRKVLGEDIWLNLALDRLNQIPGPAVVTDVRYGNEYDALVSQGAMMVRIIRPSNAPADPHPTERLAVEQVAYPAHETILNGGTLDDLRAMVDRLPVEEWARMGVQSWSTR